jgi:DNA invertase Pin-like site-specific DNA recombinase
MKIGYARVSTLQQSVDLQVDALRAVGCGTIYEETQSGAKSGKDRPELAACLKALRLGDVLVVWKLDRLARSTRELITIVQDLASRGIGFESLTEQIETNTPAGKLLFHIMGALAEFERDLIRERTKAGLETARARGRKGGRPASLSDSDKKMIKLMSNNQEISPAEIAKRFKISRATYYRTLKEVE